MTKVADLILDTHNANRGTERGLKLLDKSLRQYGAGRSVLVDKHGRVIAGNKTVERAADIGIEDVVIVPTDGTKLVAVQRTDLDLETDPAARELAYADNRTGQLDLDWNPEVLAADLQAGLNLGEWWTDNELADTLGELFKPNTLDAEAQVDRAEELRVKFGVELGQLWQCGGHRLICGDCTDRAVVERVMGGEKAELVFTDPPYGVEIGSKNRLLNSVQKAGRNLTDVKGDTIGRDELHQMLLNAFALTREFMADCCAIYVCAPQGGDLGLMMMMMMMEAGLPVRHVLNWVKNAPTFSLGRLDYEYQHEPILYTWKNSHKHYGRGQFKTSVWTIDKPRSSKEHPTMKPIELVENAVLNSSEVGQLVLDPFVGSGTSIIACENLKRRCRAIELDPGYVGVALQRFLDATGKQPVLID